MVATKFTTIRLANEVEVSLSTDLLLNNSGYFAASSRFSPQTKIFLLPTVSRQAFSLFEKWLSDPNLTEVSSWCNIINYDCPSLERNLLLVADPTTVTDKCIPGSIIDMLIDAYILADYQHAPSFQNWIMDHISVCYRYVEFHYGFPLYNLKHIFENTTKEAILRRYVIRGAFVCLTPVTLTGVAMVDGLVPEEMLTELVSLGLELRGLKVKAPWMKMEDLWHVDGLSR